MKRGMNLLLEIKMVSYGFIWFHYFIDPIKKDDQWYIKTSNILLVADAEEWNDLDPDFDDDKMFLFVKWSNKKPFLIKELLR